jgi:dihydrodipicolinate synthase/N-acetylneuraminate lyase
LISYKGIDVISDIAGELAALGYYLIADIYERGITRKTMQKLAKNLVTIKRTTRNIKRISLALIINYAEPILTILW